MASPGPSRQPRHGDAAVGLPVFRTWSSILRGFDHILGASLAARAVRDFTRRAAAVDAPVLLTGESGTGKGVVARAIHLNSARARAPMVAVNCAGVPAGLFEAEFFGHDRGAFTGAQNARRGLLEQAHAGTLLLDEVGELAPLLQAKLLTAVEEGVVRRLGAERTTRVDARIIAATAVDLRAAVSKGRFRRDLYHRLVVLSFRLPPLRERNGDIELLLDHFLHRFNGKYHRSIRAFRPAVLQRLRNHPWPGNIRQLAHVVEAATLRCESDLIGPEDLPDALLADGTPPTRPLPSRRYSFHGSPAEEQQRIRRALRACRGNKTRAAAVLGMARNTLRAKLRAMHTTDATNPADPPPSAVDPADDSGHPRTRD